MRRVLASRLPVVHVVAGTPEAIPLPDASVDAAFVAEAFHWFDLERATAELARVVRAGGGLAVLWNHAQSEDHAWHDEVFAVLEPHHRAVGGSRRVNVPWRETLEASRWFGPLAVVTVEHDQRTDRDGIVALLSSFSWIGGLPDGEREETLGAVRRVLDHHGVDAVTLRYRTTIVTTHRVDG
jgi:SAM-dependent methyltransferase